MSEDEPNYSQAYVNQVCGTCTGTGKFGSRHPIESNEFPDSREAIILEECPSCKGAGWMTYGHR